MAVVASYHAGFDQFPRLCPSLHIQHAVLLGGEFVIVNNEPFQFPNKLFATKTSTGSPSSASVEGTNPKS